MDYSKASNLFFSIIVPVYNREKDIIRCIDSVLTQNFQNFELILVNDGSTDSTAQIINAKLNSKIKFISYEQNKGVNYARNQGIKSSIGKYIIFLDSDDFFLDSDSLNLIYSLINTNIGYAHYLFRVDDRENDDSLPSDVYVYEFRHWIEGKVTGDFVHVITPSSFKDRMFIEELRIYEILNWLRIFKFNNFQLYVPKTVVCRDRNRADSVTKETLLDNEKSLNNTYLYLTKLINMYAQDYLEYDLNVKLDKLILKTLLIGISIDKNEINKELFNYITNYNMKFKFIKLVNRFKIGCVIKLGIFFKSKITN